MQVVRGVGRHVVRFVEVEGRLYALKELPGRVAEREYSLLTRLHGAAMPVVEPVGVVDARSGDLDPVLITRHLEFSLPYRVLFRGRGFSDLRERLLDALVDLLVRLHLDGFFWGDCSLSNTLFRRDAGALSAYLVDAETGEQHATLTDGERRYDLEIAEDNVAGELLDVRSEVGGLPSGIPPDQTAAEIPRRYEALWSELTREEELEQHERYRIDDRLRRLNELGYDVDEIELEGRDGRYRLRLSPLVVEPGHHRRRLRSLTGLDVQENQARRLLHDMAGFRAMLERREGRPAGELTAAYRWLREVYQPAIAALAPAATGKLEPAELFHELLEHRWYLSESRGRDVGLDEAARSYAETVLPGTPDERAIVLDPRVTPGDDDV